MKEKKKEEEKKEKKYGEPIKHDPAFSGPIHNNRRSCTDIICLLGFIVFFGAWLGVGIYGMKVGSIAKLLAPRDSNGGRCGVDSQLEDKKLLVFFDISKCLSSSTQIVKKCSTPQVCVNKCPEKTLIFKSMNKTTFSQFKSSMICTYDVNVQTLSYDLAMQNINKEKCASYVIKSHSVFGRCFMNITEAIKVKEIIDLGKNTSQITDKITDMTKMSSVAQVVQELVEARWYMLGALGAAVLVCFIYILLMRWMVAPIVWISIAALFAGLGVVMYFSYKKYKYYKNNPASSMALTAYKDPNFWLALLITAAIVTTILFLMIIFLRSRIVLAIAMISEGSKAVFAIKSTVLFPIFPWTIQCSVIAYALVVIMLLVSIGSSTYRVDKSIPDTDCKCSKYADNDPCDPKVFVTTCQNSDGGACQNTTCHFEGSINPSIIPYLHLVNALAFFWTTFFISGLGDMMLANSFSTWYWTFKKRNLPFFTLTSSIITTLRFHMGTVAFGALIIAIIRLIRILASLLRNKTQYKNPVATTIFCVLNCCLRMIENLFKFISKNAYIMCSIHGTNFCSSTRKAYSLLMRNIIRVYVLDKMIDFIFFISKVIISIGAGFAIYYYLEWTNGDRLDFIFVPAIIIAVFTYLICTIFFNVYAIAVDTLFLCFLEDCERNDGSVEKPYFMSKNLMKILGKKNKDASYKTE